MCDTVGHYRTFQTEREKANSTRDRAIDLTCKTCMIVFKPKYILVQVIKNEKFGLRVVVERNTRCFECELNRKFNLPF